MTAAPLALIGWRGPGCGPDCLPRSHDPAAHERYGYEQAMAEQRASIVRTGPLTIDLGDSGRVWVEGVEIALTDREWHVLAHLARNLGRFCPNDEVIAAVWGPEYVSETRRVRPDGYSVRTDHQILNVTIHRLRPKLGTARALISRGTPGNRNPGRRLERVEPT